MNYINILILVWDTTIRTELKKTLRLVKVCLSHLAYLVIPQDMVSANRRTNNINMDVIKAFGTGSYSSSFLMASKDEK